MYSWPFFLFSSFSSSSNATDSDRKHKSESGFNKEAGVGGGRERTRGGNERKKGALAEERTEWWRRSGEDAQQATGKPRERERDAIGATRSGDREEERC